MKPDNEAAVGILAGGGTLPREIADAVVASGRRVAIVALAGEAARDAFGPHPVTEVSWGQIGRMIRSFRSAGTRDLVIVGGVSRPDIWRIRTDMGFYRNLPRIFSIMAAGGDDSVLRRVVQFFEGHGLTVRGPAEVVPELLIAEGPLSSLEPTPAQAADARLGFQLIARLAPYDVGQAVLVHRGRVVAIEGAEGTDRMLARVAQSQGDEARGGVLVKRPKPGQELRVDMPVIGPHTVTRAEEAGLAGVVVEAGATLAAERGRLVDAAEAAGMFVVGFNPQAMDQSQVRTSQDQALQVPARDMPDAMIAQALLRSLAADVKSRGVVVVRRHVLAVETGEGVPALVARAASLRQWGRRPWSRRRGVLALATHEDATPDVLAAAQRAGYAGLVIEDASEADEFLRATLTRWAKSAGLTMTWPPAGGDHGR